MLLGPAAFHFPGWICCESFGGGSICAFFKFCLNDKTGLIFKPDTIIINHQLEFSGTRVKHFDHEKRAYKHEIWSYRISEKASTRLVQIRMKLTTIDYSPYRNSVNIVFLF